MKATGIVRRIDDLGRVVIPKEIRRTMRIREGDPLEIYTDREGEVIFKKYSPIGELMDFAAQYAESLYKTCGLPVAVCDRDSVVAAAGIPKKEYLDKKLSQSMDELIEKRSLYTAGGSGKDEHIRLTEDDRQNMFTVCAMPIFTEGDIIGCVAAVSPEENFRERTEKSALETEVKLIQTAAAFLGRQLES
ncbi:MAG: AbrB/MazE/SpoVT family DNA-binding domain-containing protein [Clostridia bacterium]|nr:AbrB/MazE/SpoVT family DNA-binding domain-containing protein [Clostridia bacterium]